MYSDYRNKVNFQKNYEYLNSRKSIADNNYNTRNNQINSINNYNSSHTNYKALPDGYKARR